MEDPLPEDAGVASAAPVVVNVTPLADLALLEQHLQKLCPLLLDLGMPLWSLMWCS
jgi:hypothetical protein